MRSTHIGPLPVTLLTVAFLVIGPVSAEEIALYDAGIAGMPPVAPDPTNVGWILAAGSR